MKDLKILGTFIWDFYAENTLLYVYVYIYIINIRTIFQNKKFKRLDWIYKIENESEKV